MRPYNLSPEIQNAIIQLTEDQVFQKIFKEDQKLDYLESLEHDKQIEFYQLQLFLKKKIRLFDIDLNPLTVALYSYLYSIQSPIVFDLKKTTMIDLDVFFYLLQTKDFSSDVGALFKKAVGYIKNEMKLDEKQVVQLFAKLYKIEFRCLNLFPKTGEEKKAMFNVDWFTSLVSKVKPLTSYTTEQLYVDVSIPQIYYYFANYCRMQGDQRIFIRTEEEILYEEDYRMCQLIVDRLIEKGIIQQQERDNILKLLAQEEK